MKLLRGLRSAVLWLIGYDADPPPPSARKPLTRRTRPPACPVCGGAGWVRCEAVLGSKILAQPIWLACPLCATAGVVPATLRCGSGCQPCQREVYMRSARFN